MRRVNTGLLSRVSSKRDEADGNLAALLSMLLFLLALVSLLKAYTSILEGLFFVGGSACGMQINIVILD